jgi:maltooligosyltrehalose trehalohydrolase
LVVCAQNHDQIGNRAHGERLSMLLDAPRLKAIAALTLLSPFVPLLFQGEEWGASTPFLYFTDHQDPLLGRLVSEGRAREFASFGWAGDVPDPQAADTFERSKLDWSEAARPPHAELLDWHRSLIALRAETYGRNVRARPKVKFDARAGWLRFEHAGVAALFNFAAASQQVPLPAGAWELALSSDPATGTGAWSGTDTGAAPGAIPANGTRVFRRRG